MTTATTQHPPVALPKDDQVLLTFEEVMRYLRVSRSSVYRLLNTYQIAGHKVGTSWRFYVGDVRKCIVKV